ncbi:hypothetical protein MRB53_025505 [Persea americana]|uniref:Uncharacterized protein n=1 Tax=Persea americana TaxID=3435 RepID=A0ACC2LFF4_PERAE|nr:hypothetical protein MRB53_025505 [Persea americana]|eukprot:TRINITY_DN39473_c2_g1_i1.p1 TRINITY_DN39473_c2_g1~~TRINITY_DN39473_c2_g1_i1.p1  ORF type:complete len:360 (+),score=55.46 TRINITY_DN39473_c2_g1_i1:92-1081(+)
MERRSCKLCSRTFANGRALGGHMRSHMALLSPSPQPHKTPPSQNQYSSSSPPSSSSSSSSEDEEEEQEEEEQEEDEKSPYYVLRENPQKSFRLADPEFSFAVDASSVIQDRESETESSRHPLRRRSKRFRKSAYSALRPDTEPEPLSSVSDTTTEEDVALCLMMLSRDVWRTDSRKSSDEQSENDEPDEDDDLPKARNRFQCETCKKVFPSYQALGGHRSSHKKIRACGADAGERAELGDSDGKVAAGEAQRRRIHQCPVCFRVFSSGQALGGHKRSHFAAAAADASPPSAAVRLGDHFIDLNLPAPAEDDDMVELSAVSDADFIHPAK